MPEIADDQIPFGSGMGSGSTEEPAVAPRLAQHIVLRGDLGWPAGPLMTQAAHCSVAALETHRNLPQTEEYLGDLDRMRKVTWKAKNEAWLQKVADRLDEAGVEYRMWTEQPENINVGLATRPATKEETQSVWKGNGVGIWR